MQIKSNQLLRDKSQLSDYIPAIDGFLGDKKIKLLGANA